MVKYGIDVNSEKISNFISEKLKDKGEFVVNFIENNKINTGGVLLKKVLIANVTNIDIYFAIDFKDNIYSTEIFCSNDILSEIIAKNLMNNLNEVLKNVHYKKEKNLYLIKNINAPVVYTRIPIEYKKMIEELILKEIINIL